ncbi:MAG: hypothetical protein JWN98_2346 [Abditibacteriota bacterium]|nr:hypothetical protein [Abditibacteriota bacterium]
MRLKDFAPFSCGDVLMFCTSLLLVAMPGRSQQPPASIPPKTVSEAKATTALAVLDNVALQQDAA